MEYFTCLYAFVACIGFSIIFELRQPLHILCASFTGAVAWLSYLLLAPLNSEVARYLLATIIGTILAEIFARLLRAPTTLFLIIAIIPMVPGGGLYYTMEALINGNTALFAELGLHTAACAAAIAAGVSLVSSLTRILFHRPAPDRSK
jgi:uncharacterized membrane protein YjjB (DUF3815 family)